ncbi:MAG: helix-turn-helix domain-containing protein [Ferruginibacter sp.]
MSGLLKTLIGLTTQQHIKEKIIEKAKQQLSTTNLSVSEIAYQLGFEHPSRLVNCLNQNKTVTTRI